MFPGRTVLLALNPARPVSHPSAPAELRQPLGDARLPEKHGHASAHAARTRHVFRARTRNAPGASRAQNRRRPAALPGAPTRPARGMSGFWIRQVGLHRISFVRASEESSRTVFSIRWKARGRVVSWPDRPDGVPSYSAPPPLAASPCAAPTRVACSVSGF